MSDDVIVIGGGPAGATAALMLARAGVATTLVDPLGVGGQLINIEHVPDFPGFPRGVAGWDLAAALGEAVLDAGCSLVLARAETLHLGTAGREHRVLADGREHRAARVLVATGCRPRPPAGAEGLEGHGVSYCAACDGGLFAGATVAVIGGGDIALAEACSLAPLAEQVHVLLPGPRPDAARAWLDAAAALANVVLVADAHAPTVLEAEGRVHGVRFVDSGGATTVLAVGGVFGGLPGIPQSELLASSAPLDRDGAVTTDGRLAVAGVAGLFAAGDVRAGSARRAVAAAGDGAAAADAILAGLR